MAFAAGVVLAALVVAMATARRPPRLAPANVVLVLVDTLRADHLGTYGYPRPTSPQIDRLAERSLVFTRARSVAPWTSPTIASLFLGRHPNALLAPRPHAEAIREPLPAQLPTLASKLREAGVTTLAFVDHPGISPGLGFDRGFDTFVRLYRHFEVPAFGRVDGRLAVAEIARHLEMSAGERYFAYLHLIYPHRPYDAPDAYEQLFGATTDDYRRRKKTEVVNAYDAEIRYTDDFVGELVATLDRMGRLDDTWIVVTSDHGEGFWEHGRAEHGNSLYDELLHVPLLLAPPRSAGLGPRRVAAAVSLLDLHSTVLEMAGVTSAAAAPGDEGASLLRFLALLPGRATTPLISQQPHSGDVRGTALVSPPWKLIRRHENELGKVQLYDLERDPGERRNLATERRELVRRLDAELAGHLLADQTLRDALRSSGAGEGELDADEVERLRALGYLQ